MAEKFDFNYSFVENEEQILAEWERENYFGRLKEKNANGKKYKFIDGPITANNPMGIHHAWGRTLKDTFLRFKAMQGYQSHYRNGFDGQGLWVEVEVEKDLGFKTKKDIEEYGLDKFSDKCIERVKKFSGIITEQSKRLGQWMDWDNSYYTYKDNNITAIWQVLKICHENGWLKQIYKPMPWCPRCGTSLSEHEMSGSYKEVEHIAVFIKLPLVGEDADMLVWTTTPWTLTSNVALAVNPQLDYVKVKLDGEARPLIMGKTYFNTKFAGKAQILDSFKGEALAGREFETCFPELELQKDIEHKVVMWDEVLDDEGCGVVHIAPGCGAEDYELGLREKLAVIIPIDEYGIFLKEAGFLAGKDAKLARDEIFEELKKRKKLFYTHPFKHSYPVCWRCKTEILFRCVKEWAIDVEELRPRLIANASKVKWNPPYQGKRMLDWLNNMSDWNISRKRFYGLPLPFYVCEECGELTVVGSREELRELAVDASLVDALPHIHRPWIDKVEIKCPKCKAHVSRVPEVGDVWLDAGIVPFSTLKYFEDREYWKSYFPAEYVVEMKEQIRLWFYSMLFMSTVLIDEPPYLEVGTHGMVAAEDGSRFSKTGFMIKFDEAADKIGADASRYLFASSSMSTDVRFGFNLGDAAKRKLLGYWNLSTFFVTYAEVDHPTVDTSKLEVAALAPIDKWLVTTVNSFIESATEAMNEYTTKNVVTVFEKAIDDISNFYIRVNRRRFWKVENNADKQTAYTVLLYAIKKITQVMAPIIPFMTEYVWKNVIARYEDGIEDSVHLSDWPTVLSGVDTKDAIIAQVDYARSVISLVLKLRSEKQIRIRQPLATLYICSGEKAPAIEQVLLDVIKSEVNVKAVKIIDDRSILEDYVAALDFKQAGSVLKADVNKVKELLTAQSDADMQRTVDEIRLGGDVAVTGFDRALPARIFLLCAVPKKHITLEQEGDLL
ncbi:MAG: isoleucine--tRNA ligase, partial [Oscillospiraceae bacterium]